MMSFYPKLVCRKQGGYDRVNRRDNAAIRTMSVKYWSEAGTTQLESARQRESLFSYTTVIFIAALTKGQSLTTLARRLTEPVT